MFYSQLVLAKKGPLGKIWLAAHMEKKVPKLQIVQTNIPESVNDIQNPTVPMALRVSGHLLLGVVRIFSKKVTYLLSDCSEALVKIKDAFRAPGGVELAPGAGTKGYDELTRANQLADEDELDPELMSQPMLFDDDDDALLGIQIEEEEELMAAPGIDDPVDDEEADKDQFGATAAFEHFFRQGAGEEVEEEDDGRPSGKRSRKSRDADVADAAEEEDEEDDSRLPTETLRSGGLRLEEPVVGGHDVDEDVDFDEPEEEELGLNAFAPSGELGEDEGLGEMEDYGEEEDDEAANPLGGVMQEPAARPKRGVDKADKADKASKQPLSKGKAKRKMVIDEETQISSEQIRKQLNDPEELKKIIRDFDIEEAAYDAAAAREDDWDPIAGPPRAPYLPSGIADFACFQPNPRRPDAKKARLSDAAAAKRAAADRAAAAEDDEEMEEEAPEGEFDDADDEMEQLRSAGPAEPGSGVADAASRASGVGASPSGAGFEPADELPMADFGQEDEEAAAEDDDLGAMEEPIGAALPPVSDEPEVDTGFDPKVKLPNVDADSKEDADGQGASQDDPAHWNPRTRKMYEVLADAFEASGDKPLSYNAMIAPTKASKISSAEKRKIVSGCFQELLFLTTHGLVDIDQQRPYGNLLVSKTELFVDAAA